MVSRYPQNVAVAMEAAKHGEIGEWPLSSAANVGDNAGCADRVETRALRNLPYTQVITHNYYHGRRVSKVLALFNSEGTNIRSLAPVYTSRSSAGMQDHKLVLPREKLITPAEWEKDGYRHVRDRLEIPNECPGDIRDEALRLITEAGAASRQGRDYAYLAWPE